MSDDDVRAFLAEHVDLGIAIKTAYELFQSLDPSTTYELDELTLIHNIYNGWCNFYAEDTVNPYVPLYAKGPWIITMHGAVIHDSGGYGMLGFGHNPDEVLKTMCQPQVMANIMTPCLAQKRLVEVLREEIGRMRENKECPYEQFILMNSGSEGNSVADRIIDIHTGHARGTREQVVGVSLKNSFHGRTLKPAVLSDSSAAKYAQSKCDTILRMKRQYNRHVEVNDLNGLQFVFDEAKKRNEFIEAVHIEAVMGEGNPGQGISPDFYALARRLTMENDAMLVIDSVQAGIRCHGCLSLVDYPGFEILPAPDFEVFSKAINAGQYPVSLVALSTRALASYKRGVYGNTMTSNPRACEIVSTVMLGLTQDVRTNIKEMGQYALGQFKNLQAKYPSAILNVTGTGLLYAVHLDPHTYPVVAGAGAEYWLRTQGVGVIHGGENALRFTPHFRVTKLEIDLQVRTLERFFKATGYLTPQLELIDRTQQTQLAGPSTLLFIKGHLFDRNVVNDILTAIEKAQGCRADISRLRLGCSATEESEMTLEITAVENQTLENATQTVKHLALSNGCIFKPTTQEIEATRL